MAQTKYQIFELSARAVMSYAVCNDDGVYTFNLDRAATEKCKVFGATHVQDGNALFHQIMLQRQGDEWKETKDEFITDLAHIIFYMDFSKVFDRRGARSEIHQAKARDLFRPEGVWLDFGHHAHCYLAFERSGSMSRQSRLSFIRADYYNSIHRRMMLDLRIGRCQLSKLYAYNGLMLSGGVRVDGIRIDQPHRVIVVANDYSDSKGVKVITVTDQSGDGNIRRFQREEKSADITYMLCDGEGMVSKEYAKVIDRAYCGRHTHTSFQIRLPFIKGMLHQVDFKDFLKRMGVSQIRDVWGMLHPLADVDIILTKSQFKGYDWLMENEKTWEDYWQAFRDYDHALYITNVSKEKPEAFTELNYQFLNTVSLTADEFRPPDLPDGWRKSPAEDERHWLTKETELAYYRLCADERRQREFFLQDLEREDLPANGLEMCMAGTLEKNPLFLSEPAYVKRLEAQAEKILKGYAVGRLIVAGDNRYLSGDLLYLMICLSVTDKGYDHSYHYFRSKVIDDCGFQDTFYAPGAVYRQADYCTLLRNPHIARNEEVQMTALPDQNRMHRIYLSHLTDVVVVDYRTMAAERLGGADYDGDMVKTIADPIINDCVWRNYEKSPDNARANAYNLPLLLIPSITPQLSDANDWQARFETVRNTFSSRVGQICNAALDRSVIAYNENSGAEERQRCREETELLAILTGLEIDAAKTGVRPDLTEYLGQKTVPRSLFLKYKQLAEEAETRRAWYEPTHAAKLKAFFEKTDWSQVDSNLERLPWLAHQLKKNTPHRKQQRAKDEELFRFAQEECWRDKLSQATLTFLDELIRDYETCLSRIRSLKAPLRNKRHQQDIERILYARGQEEDYDVDELYARFGALPPGLVTEMLATVRERQWHFLDVNARKQFLREGPAAAELSPYLDLLCDFRYGGYRVLGDLLCDMEEENRDEDNRQLFRDGDSPALRALLQAYLDKQPGQSYREAVAKRCRKQIKAKVKLSKAVRYLAALGRRDLLWDLLWDQVEKEACCVK